MPNYNEAERKRRLAEGRFYSTPTPKPQDYLDLDATGFLIVALGHLVKAKEKLDQEPPARGTWKARLATQYATNHTRYALKVLDELKEEICEKP